MHAQICSCKEELSAVTLGGDIVVGDDTDTSRVDVRRVSEIKNQHLRLQRAQLVLDGKHRRERKWAGEFKDRGSFARIDGEGGVIYGSILHAIKYIKPREERELQIDEYGGSEHGEELTIFEWAIIFKAMSFVYDAACCPCPGLEASDAAAC